MLMSTEEALAYVHGEMQTIRDGAVTHQAVQTNLADVICGGESSVACLTILKSHEATRSSECRIDSYPGRSLSSLRRL